MSTVQSAPGQQFDPALSSAPHNLTVNLAAMAAQQPRHFQPPAMYAPPPNNQHYVHQSHLHPPSQSLAQHPHPQQQQQQPPPPSQHQQHQHQQQQPHLSLSLANPPPPHLQPQLMQGQSHQQSLMMPLASPQPPYQLNSRPPPRPAMMMAAPSPAMTIPATTPSHSSSSPPSALQHPMGFNPALAVNHQPPIIPNNGTRRVSNPPPPLGSAIPPQSQHHPMGMNMGMGLGLGMGMGMGSTAATGVPALMRGSPAHMQAMARMQQQQQPQQQQQNSNHQSPDFQQMFAQSGHNPQQQQQPQSGPPPHQQQPIGTGHSPSLQHAQHKRPPSSQRIAAQQPQSQSQRQASQPLPTPQMQHQPPPASNGPTPRASSGPRTPHMASLSQPPALAQAQPHLVHHNPNNHNHPRPSFSANTASHVTPQVPHAPSPIHRPPSNSSHHSHPPPGSTIQDIRSGTVFQNQLQSRSASRTSLHEVSMHSPHQTGPQPPPMQAFGQDPNTMMGRMSQSGSFLPTPAQQLTMNPGPLPDGSSSGPPGPGMGSAGPPPMQGMHPPTPGPSHHIPHPQSQNPSSQPTSSQNNTGHSPNSSTSSTHSGSISRQGGGGGGPPSQSHPHQQQAQAQQRIGPPQAPQLGQGHQRSTSHPLPPQRPFTATPANGPPTSSQGMMNGPTPQPASNSPPVPGGPQVGVAPPGVVHPSRNPYMAPIPLGQGQAIKFFLRFAGTLTFDDPNCHLQDFWEEIIGDHFHPEGVMRFTLWKDNMRQEVKPFDIGPKILPRFFLVTFQSGVRGMSFSMDGATERLVPAMPHVNAHAVVECKNASWTYRYASGYTVILRGPLVAKVQLDPNSPPSSPRYQITEFNFDASTHEQHISLGAIQGSRISGGDASKRSDDPQSSKARGTEDARIVYERAYLPPEPINAFGIPQVTMRCLELAESCELMGDLMSYCGSNGGGPSAALESFAQHIRSTHPGLSEAARRLRAGPTSTSGPSSYPNPMTASPGTTLQNSSVPSPASTVSPNKTPALAPAVIPPPLGDGRVPLNQAQTASTPNGQTIMPTGVKRKSASDAQSDQPPPAKRPSRPRKLKNS